MDYEKEIPFGAFDSELMHQEIFIPEGFTATIDGDKIILTRKESKNEKIRKRLIDFFEDWHKNRSHCWGIAVTDILAWLEKHAEVDSDEDDIEAKEKDIRKAFNKIWDEKQGTSNELEKQGEQPKEATYTHEVETGNGNIKALVTEKVQLPKFKVKYAGSEYNVLKIKDIAGVIFYGIEDEPNHIDYVKAENCEIINGYAIKENGSPYPNKPAVFSEQKPAWSEEDEKMLNSIIEDFGDGKTSNMLQEYWLKTLKERYTWKPSDKQMRALEYIINNAHNTSYSCKIAKELLEQLKKLKGE